MKRKIEKRQPKESQELNELFVEFLNFGNELNRQWEKAGDFAFMDFLTENLKQFDFSEGWTNNRGEVLIDGSSGGYGAIWCGGDLQTAKKNLNEMFELLKRQLKLQAFK